jgi:hypothetical protein
MGTQIMTIKQVFCSTFPSCVYVFKNGKHAPFIAGEYHTADPIEIEELTAEITRGHEVYHFNEAKREVDTNNIDPLEYIKKKAVEEYLAKQTAANNPNNDRGSTEETKLAPQVTTKLVTAASSNATPTSK